MNAALKELADKLEEIRDAVAAQSGSASGGVAIGWLTPQQVTAIIEAAAAPGAPAGGEDTARLDWMENNAVRLAPNLTQDPDDGEKWCLDGPAVAAVDAPTIREAIDAARSGSGASPLSSAEQGEP